MKEEYDYNEEVKKWLKSKPNPGIRIGKNYQAVIPEFNPLPRAKKEEVVVVKDKKEDKNSPVPQKPAIRVVPVKDANAESIKETSKAQKRVEAEPSVQAGEDSSKSDSSKKSKVDQ